MARAKQSVTERIEDLEGFKDGVLALVSKYFGRKRAGTKAKAKRTATNGAERAAEESYE